MNSSNVSFLVKQYAEIVAGWDKLRVFQTEMQAVASG